MKIKSSIVDTSNCLNSIFLAFSSLNQKLSFSFCLIDIFSSCFYFNSANCKDTDAKFTHQNKLKNIYKSLSNNQDTVLIITNISIKNNITILVWREYEIIVKTIYYTMNILSIEAKHFAIRYSISQVFQIYNISYIVIIINTIYTAKYIFNMSIYSYQLWSITVSKEVS